MLVNVNSTKVLFIITINFFFFFLSEDNAKILKTKIKVNI